MHRLPRETNSVNPIKFLTSFVIKIFYTQASWNRIKLRTRNPSTRFHSINNLASCFQVCRMYKSRYMYIVVAHSDGQSVICLSIELGLRISGNLQRRITKTNERPPWRIVEFEGHPFQSVSFHVRMPEWIIEFSQPRSFQVHAIDNLITSLSE